MTKESKTVSTIRRRKGKEVALALQKIKEENVAPSPEMTIASDSEIQAADAEDKCYMFDVLGLIILRRLMSQPRSMFLALLAIRCTNALLIQTQYVPDEYWQSMEVAHKMVFGYGYLTWEWREGLRGYSYPLLFATFYKLTYMLGLDSRFLLIKLPRLIQACIAAWGDIHLYKLSARLAGRSAAQWTLLCQLLSWFTIYCSTRTLSNSTEASLIVIALSYFPWPDQESKESCIRKFLLFAALSVVVRPTAALVWVLLCCWHLQWARHSAKFKAVVNTYLVIGLSTLGISALVDRIWYGQWTLVQLNFLWFNVVRGGASIYGTHPWHWYMWQGFPVVMGTLIFPFVLGAWHAKDKTLLWVIAFILATHSLLPHKEFRFILPTVPLAMHYCGLYFQRLCSRPTLKEVKAELRCSGVSATKIEGKEPLGGLEKKVEDDSSKAHGDVEEEVDEKKVVEEMSALVKGEDDTDAGREERDSQKSADDKTKFKNLGTEKEESDLKGDSGLGNLEAHQEQQHQSCLTKARALTAILALTNLLPAFYFCLIHQRGTIMVTKFLADAAEEAPGNVDILFLMPCHSTPFYSYIHANVTMRFLTCEPEGVAGSQVPIASLPSPSTWLDEADQFFDSPVAWLKHEFNRPGGRSWPSHLVYFSSLHRDISAQLVQAGYKMCGNFFHTHFPEGRVGGSVLVSCR